jgi:hypothetical protein
MHWRALSWRISRHKQRSRDIRIMELLKFRSGQMPMSADVILVESSIKRYTLQAQQCLSQLTLDADAA